MMSSVLIRAMRRRGLLQRGQVVSISNVFFNSSAHGMYVDLQAGLFLSAGVAVVSAGAGTTWLWRLLCDDSTPKYPVRCRRGGGTRAARRASTVFPLDSLPSGLRPLAELMPLTHAVRLTRSLTVMRGSYVLILDLAFMLVVTAAVAAWAIRRLKRRIMV
jgi:hypothetical protein